MSAGIRLIEECKVVQQQVPLDVNGAGVDATKWFSMKNWAHATVIISAGNVAGNAAVTLKQTTDVANAGSDEKALGFSKMYQSGVALTSDTYTENAVTSNTFNILATGGDSTTYVIEIDAEDLDVANGFDCFAVEVADPSAACLLSIVIVFSGGRYKTEGGLSVLSN